METKTATTEMTALVVSVSLSPTELQALDAEIERIVNESGMQINRSALLGAYAIMSLRERAQARQGEA